MFQGLLRQFQQTAMMFEKRVVVAYSGVEIETNHLAVFEVAGERFRQHRLINHQLFCFNFFVKSLYCFLVARGDGIVPTDIGPRIFDIIKKRMFRFHQDKE